MRRVRLIAAANAPHWPVSGQLWIAIAGLIGATIVARMLGLEAFGTYFFALIISSCVAIAVDLCVGQAILTRVEGYERNYLIWRRIAVGVTSVAAVVILLAGLALLSGSDDKLMWVLLCAALPLTASSMIPRSFLVLQGQLRHVAVVDVISVCLGNFTAVVLVLTWPSPAAAAVGPLVIAVVRSCALEFAFKSRQMGPKPVSELGWKTGYRSLWQAVGGIYTNQLSGFVSRNGDNLIVSLLLGPVNLALYSRAFSFLVGPLQQAQMALNPLMLRDATDARIAGKSSQHLTSIVGRFFSLMIPLPAAVSAIGPELVTLILGPSWEEAGEIMTLSVGLAISMTVALPARWLLLSARNTLSLRIDSVLQFSLLGGCAIGALLWGLQGAMLINSIVLGPLISIVAWMLLPRYAQSFFWRRAAPIAVALASIPFAACTALRLVTSDPVMIVSVGVSVGIFATALTYGLIALRTGKAGS